ncbi:hypothetical protein KBI23_05635 [bacterium]|nr:hypothetical protein [bacterium]MBP9810422.1 hypothetical protein [bacterium]
MSEKETNNSSKSLMVKLLELIIKGVMGFFMLFYLLWKNTAEPLHKEVYDNNWSLKPIGGALALGSGIVAAFLLSPVLGPWALAASVVTAVLTYSHIFPVFYIVALRPIYRLLCRFKEAIRTALRKLFSYLWPVVRFGWRHFLKFVNWLDKVFTIAWNWLSKYVGRFFRFVWPHIVTFVKWLDKVISAVWNWLSKYVGCFVRFAWPHIISVFRWLDYIITTVWDWLSAKVSAAWRTISTKIVAVWILLDAAISPYLARLGKVTGRFFKQLLIWAHSVWSVIAPLANSVSTWSMEIWDSLSRLYARLSRTSNK